MVMASRLVRNESLSRLYISSQLSCWTNIMDWLMVVDQSGIVEAKTTDPGQFGPLDEAEGRNRVERLAAAAAAAARSDGGDADRRHVDADAADAAAADASYAAAGVRRSVTERLRPVGVALVVQPITSETCRGSTKN